MSENPYTPPQAELSIESSTWLTLKLVVSLNLLALCLDVIAIVEMTTNSYSNPIAAWLSLLPILSIFAFIKFTFTKSLRFFCLFLNLAGLLVYVVAMTAILLTDALVLWQGQVFVVFMLIVFTINLLFCFGKKA